METNFGWLGSFLSLILILMGLVDQDRMKGIVLVSYLFKSYEELIQKLSIRRHRFRAVYLEAYVVKANFEAEYVF